MRLLAKSLKECDDLISTKSSIDVGLPTTCRSTASTSPSDNIFIMSPDCSIFIETIQRISSNLQSFEFSIQSKFAVRMAIKCEKFLWEQHNEASEIRTLNFDTNNTTKLRLESEISIQTTQRNSLECLDIFWNIQNSSIYNTMNIFRIEFPEEIYMI